MDIQQHTTYSHDSAATRVTVTRRHHPLQGQTLDLVKRGRTQIVVRLDDGTSMRLPRAWSSLDGDPSPHTDTFPPLVRCARCSISSTPCGLGIGTEVVVVTGRWSSRNGRTRCQDKSRSIFAVTGCERYGAGCPSAAVETRSRSGRSSSPAPRARAIHHAWSQGGAPMTASADHVKVRGEHQQRLAFRELDPETQKVVVRRGLRRSRDPWPVLIQDHRRGPGRNRRRAS